MEQPQDQPDNSAAEAEFEAMRNDPARQVLTEADALADLNGTPRPSREA